MLNQQVTIGGNASVSKSMTASFGFGGFVLTPAQGKLSDDGVTIPLGRRTYELLLALIEHRHRVVSKEELMDRVWPNQAVEGNNLTVTMSALRKALREGADGQTYIQTVSGRGYRFVAAVHASGPAPPAEAAAPNGGMPSIAVLPFTNLSGDPGQEHFGDGIAEDIISELSRNRWLTVIARNSSFTLKGTPVDMRLVATLFGVRYVLEGSVRSIGQRVRVTAQLMDASSNSHVTAVRYDQEIADVFTAQDEITHCIIAAVRPALYEVEQDRSLRRHPENIDAWSAYQRGVWQLSRFEEPESAQARAWFERAIALGPFFAPGYYGLAQTYLHDGSAFAPNTPADWQARGENLAVRAIELDERDSGAHSMLGLAKMVRGDHAGSLDATARALALNPNDATAHGTHGATLIFNGHPHEGLASIARSLRLSPRDPRLRIRHAHRALGHYFAGELREAEAVAQELLRRWPSYAFGHRFHAMVLAETGRLHDAKLAMQHATALSPALFKDFSQAKMPWYRRDDHRRVVAALRIAGWTGRSD